MKAKRTSNNHPKDPLRVGRDLTKLKPLGRLGELGKVASAEAVEPRNIKVHISIKLDADVLEWFKAQAKDPASAGYQTLINAALRERMEGGAAAAVQAKWTDEPGRRLMAELAQAAADLAAKQSAEQTAERLVSLLGIGNLEQGIRVHSEKEARRSR